MKEPSFSIVLGERKHFFLTIFNSYLFLCRWLVSDKAADDLQRQMAQKSIKVGRQRSPILCRSLRSFLTFQLAAIFRCDDVIDCKSYQGLFPTELLLATILSFCVFLLESQYVQQSNSTSLQS